MQLLYMGIFILMWTACYAIPAFLLTLSSVAIYAVTRKKIKGIRAILTKALCLTPLSTIAFALMFHGLIYILQPAPIALENVSADNFRLSSYYSGSPSLLKAIEKIFPLGTKKDDIDKILMEREGASIHEGRNTPQGKTVTYRHRAWPWTCYPWGGEPVVSIVLTYDASMKLTDIFARQMPSGCSYP